MAAFNKFNAFAENVVEGINLGSDSFIIALTDVAPVAGNSILADITQISYVNLSSRAVTTTSSSQAAGVETLVLQDLTLTASGAVAQFRYVVLYDDTVAVPVKPLVGWWDYGSEVNMLNLETFLIDFVGATITLS
jgi:hypothetical protein